MAQSNLPHMPQSVLWDTFTSSHISTLKLFLLYALPLSLVAPVMIHYAGVTYGGHLLPALSEMRLDIIGSVFFVSELVMTFLVAFIIQRLGELTNVKPAYEDAYKLAVIVPTPLWLAPLFLFIPSFDLNITVGALAMILSGMLIFYGVPSILKVKDEGAIMLAGSILAVGLVAWAAMMFLTLLTWSFVTYWVFA